MMIKHFYVEINDKNWRLGPKLINSKKITILVPFLWNLFIIACSWVDHIDRGIYSAIQRIFQNHGAIGRVIRLFRQFELNNYDEISKSWCESWQKSRSAQVEKIMGRKGIFIWQPFFNYLRFPFQPSIQKRIVIHYVFS